jgi:hypothetical protein
MQAQIGMIQVNTSQINSISQNLSNQEQISGTMRNHGVLSGSTGQNMQIQHQHCAEGINIKNQQ